MNKLSQSELIDLLKQAGFKATTGKLAVLSFLRKAKAPHTLNEITDALKLDMTTVYRTLKGFAEAGIISSTKLGTKSEYYELIHGRGHHHHIVCTECGVVEDVSIDHSDLVEKVLKKASNFKTLSSHEIEFYGVCNKCG